VITCVMTGLDLDNYEGMALGTVLADGRRTLLLVNDNNYNSHQVAALCGLAI
jgi:hypothetical protein